MAVCSIRENNKGGQELGFLNALLSFMSLFGYNLERLDTKNLESTEFWFLINSVLSQPQLNLNSTQKLGVT